MHGAFPNYVRENKEAEITNLSYSIIMSIHIKISTTLRPYVSGYDPEQGIDINADSETRLNLAELAEKLGIPLDEIKFVMVNGRYQPMDSTITDGDRVAYFPAVGGG